MRTILIALTLTITSIAAAQNDRGLLLALTSKFANTANFTITNCPELDFISVCLIGTGSKDLDKRFIDAYLPDIINRWTTPWHAANNYSYGRAADTVIGSIAIVTIELSPHLTTIIFWYPNP